MNAQQIRKQFLDYFKSKQHKIVDSAPLVVKNDPTLLFINAGMNPFKDIFLGNRPAMDKRVADTQKCLRVSGKHNDLEEVGVDTYHHTMFEMLGNWSFGDYFKAEAIQYAWELLTEVYKLPKDRLYVTIFEGDDAENLAKDEESKTIWEKYIASDRILLGNKKDNFWEMGDVGPCGPCTEIHFDSRTDEERARIDGKTLVNNDDPNVIEIWNNVFMEFNRKADSTLENLPAQHVDTGMGFERLVRVIQGKQSNYDTDLFMPFIQHLEELSGLKYEFGDSKKDIAFRVISDHIRAISFTIADGQIPSNTGAGYVIRRILRRAVRYGYSYLGFDSPFLFKLLPILGSMFEDVFPEVNAQKSYIENVIKEEENSFFKTLSNGIKIFQELSQKTNQGVISGKDAFTLYDTYGFPIDLTKLLALEHNLKVDEEAFEAELDIQKNRSRNAGKMETDDWIQVSEDTDTTDFVGYDNFQTESKILKYRKVMNKNNTLYQIVLDRTPFYAESGGQVGDTGVLKNTNGDVIEIINTVKENDSIFHLTPSMPSDVSGVFTATIDKSKRVKTAKNHSATHLLQAALRVVLGKHVEQKGSLVNDKILRFDFSHFAKLTEDEIVQVEQWVNQRIHEEIEGLIESNIPIEEAKSRGVMALFGEKYGEFVRVVTFDPNVSQELCGGTHVKNTSELGYFKILSESSIASGVRRIEATTADNVIDYYKSKEKTLDDIAQVLKNPQKIVPTVQNLLTENNEQKKTIEKYEAYIATSEAKKIENSLKEGVAVVHLGEMSSDIVKSIATELRKNHSTLKLGIAFVEKDKFKIAIALGDASSHLKAGDIVKELATIIKGGGGGQPNFAIATGAIETEFKMVEDKLLQVFKG